MNKYRDYLQQIPDGCILCDAADGTILDTNQQFCEIIGYTRQELIGLNFEASRGTEPPLITQQAIEDVREAATNGPQQFEWVGKTKTGERVLVEARLKQISVDGNQCIIATVRDITEQREQKQGLEAHVAAMEASIDGMAILDEDEEYAFVNQAHTDIYGYDKPDAFLGESWRICYREDELTRFDEVVMPSLFEQGDWRGEATGVRKNGSTFQQELSLTLTDDNRVICVVRDITERKRREREVQRQNERLEEFTSVVSHDLRNPLSVAEGQVELARREFDSVHLDHATEALRRSHTLIDELITLAREGDRVGDMEAVVLGKVAEGCWQTVPTERAELQVNTNSTIRADRSALQQLLENLIRNAIEHSDGAPTVSIGDLDDGFYIADDGPGIPADKRNQVFESGYSTIADGTGFGLSIVAEIVEAHNWEIQVTDSDSGGAQFEITEVKFLG